MTVPGVRECEIAKVRNCGIENQVLVPEVYVCLDTTDLIIDGLFRQGGILRFAGFLAAAFGLAFATLQDSRSGIQQLRKWSNFSGSWLPATDAPAHRLSKIPSFISRSASPQRARQIVPAKSAPDKAYRPW